MSQGILPCKSEVEPVASGMTALAGLLIDFGFSRCLWFN
jgi:hypothetical protein